jgi:hypothetical protein
LGAPDPLAALLDAEVRNTGGQNYKVLALFGDRPEVLRSITEAHARGVSPDKIARLLSRDGGSISGSAVENWLKRPADG